MIKYRSQYGYPYFAIVAKEVARETEHTVVLPTEGGHPGTKELKRAEYHAWHDTFSHAQEYLIDEERRKIATLESKLARARDRLAHIQAMTESE